MSASSSVAYDQSRIPPRAGPERGVVHRDECHEPRFRVVGAFDPLVAGDVDGGEPHGRHPARRLRRRARDRTLAARDPAEPAVGGW